MFAGGVTCCSPSISLHCHLLEAAAQLVNIITPPPQLMNTVKSVAMPQTQAPPRASKRKAQVTSIAIEVSDALVTMQTAYVVPQHVSERHVKLLVGCQQQIQLQQLQIFCQPADLGLKASLTKLQIFSLQESVEQLGRSESLTTRRSDLMDVQIRDVLTGLRPTGSMPERTASGQQPVQPGVHKNHFFSLASFSAAGSAPDLVSELQGHAAPHIAGQTNLEVAISDVGVLFEPDDAFAACATLRDATAAARLLALQRKQDAAVHAASSTPASTGAKAPGKQKHVALLKHMQNAKLHLCIGPLSFEAALAREFNWKVKASTLDVLCDEGATGSLQNGIILLNERSLVSCSSAVLDCVHPVIFKPKNKGEKHFHSICTFTWFTNHCQFITAEFSAY